MIDKPQFTGDWIGHYLSLKNILRHENNYRNDMSFTFFELTSRKDATDGMTELNKILICDNFFLDTLEVRHNLLNDIFHESKASNREVNMVLLNPFSLTAKERSKSLAELEKEPLSLPQRVNRGLFNIFKCMKEEPHNGYSSIKDDENSSEFIFTQLELIEKYKNDKKLNFTLTYNDQISYPCYIFLTHGFKGNFHAGHSSRLSSWYHYVNTIYQDDFQDMYNGFHHSLKNSFVLTKKIVKERLMNEANEINSRLVQLGF